MESRMLAEIKPDIKPEAAVAVTPRQLQERKQTQTVLPSNASQVSQPAEQVVNFGWEEIKDFPILPFVKRQTENYVAHQIVVELVYKNIRMEFSNEMLFCMALIMEKMTQNEADTFNEINREHCDHGIVGQHRFKANEFMFQLEQVRKLIDYYKACKNLVFRKIKDNNLFGFIAIAGESDVPFIYSDSRQLVPLFYFEGQNQYLDDRSIELTDPFKIGYLKFCYKVQKINKLFYEQNPLKVVDLEDVKKLFPAGTTFNICIPKIINQELLAPEIRVARLYGLEEEMPLSQDVNASIPSSSNSVEGEIGTYIPSTPPNSEIEPSDNSNHSDDTVILENSLIESKKQKENAPKENDSDPIARNALETEFKKYKQHMRLKITEDKKAKKRSAQAVGETDPKRYKIDEVNLPVQSTAITTGGNISNYLSNSSASLPQSKTTQLIASGNSLQPQDLSRKPISQQFSVTPIQPKKTNKQQSNSNVRGSGFATEISVVALPSNLSRINRTVQQSSTITRERNVSHHLSNSGASLRQSKSTQVIASGSSLQRQDLSLISQELTVTPIQRKETNKQQSNSAFATGTPRSTPSSMLSIPNRNIQVTNVPYQSPRGASSPGLPQVIQVNEAVHRVSGYSQYSTPATTVANSITYPPSMNLHQNHASKQLSYSTQHYPNMIDAQQQNSGPYSVPNSLSNSGPYYQPLPAQVTSSQSYSYATPSENINLQNQYIAEQHNLEIQKQREATKNWWLMRQQWMSEQHIQQRSLAPNSTQQIIQQPSNLSHNQQQMQQRSLAPNSTQQIIQQPSNLSHNQQQMQQRSLAPNSTQQIIQQPSNLPHNQQQMQPPSSFLLPQQSAMQQSGAFSSPPGLINSNQAFHATPASNTGSHFQQYGNSSEIVVQNVNISYTNNTYSQNYVQNNYPGSPASTNMMFSTNLLNNQDLNNNRHYDDNNNNAINISYLESKITILKHPAGLDLNPELYATTVVTINRKCLLGIEKFPYSSGVVVNLSEYVEKVLGPNTLDSLYYLLIRVVKLYKLHPIQKVQWDKVSQMKKLQLVGLFKDVFIDYEEIRER